MKLSELQNTLDSIASIETELKNTVETHNKLKTKIIAEITEIHNKIQNLYNDTNSDEPKKEY